MENRKTGENPNVSCHHLVENYGRAREAEIITHAVTRTIIITKCAMRGKKPVYNVLLKDPIAGKLIIKTDHVLKLQYVGKDNSRRDWFTAGEVKSMRKIMPGFDKYYEVRRAGYANEED